MNSTDKRRKAFISSLVVFFGTLILILCFVGGVKQLCSAFQGYDVPITKVNTKERKVALTFDVAWDSNNIEEILDTLDKYNVKATFFLVGNWIDDNEELVREIHNRGHEIGNHSNTHSSFPDISDEDKIDEIVETGNKIKSITGEKTNLFRPPFGRIDKDTMNVCKTLNYYTVKWDVDSGDWKNIGAMNVVDRVTKNTTNGSIVLFHTNIRGINTYLEPCIKNLEKKNYSMVKVSDLIYKDNYQITSSGEQRKLKDD